MTLNKIHLLKVAWCHASNGVTASQTNGSMAKAIQSLIDQKPDGKCAPLLKELLADFQALDPKGYFGTLTTEGVEEMCPYAMEAWRENC